MDIEPRTDEGPATRPEPRILLGMAVACVLCLVAAIVAVSVLLWDKPDPTVAYVPVPVLQWAFIGGMIAVLYRLAYRPNTPGLRLYIWAVAKPVIGMAMGALVYFLAMGGVFILAPAFHTTPEPVVQTDVESRQPGAQQSHRPINVSIFLLNALAFMGGFSEQFSTGLIRRITSDGSPDPDPSARSPRDQP